MGLVVGLIEHLTFTERAVVPAKGGAWFFLKRNSRLDAWPTQLSTGQRPAAMGPYGVISYNGPNARAR
jgi:hypothetical protein